MRNLKYKLLTDLRQSFENQSIAIERYDSIDNTFDRKGISDDFLAVFKIFLAMYPMPTKRRNIYDKMETDSQRIGYIAKHLIKVGNETDELGRHLVDEFVRARKQYDYWADYYKREIERIDENIGKLDVDDPHLLKKMYDYGKREGKYQESYREIKNKRNKATFKLMIHVCEAKRN